MCVSPEAQFVCKVFLKKCIMCNDLIEAAVNALGGKHPILNCTWRKNPEERRVSDWSAVSDPDQRKPGGLQLSIEIARHQELKAPTSGGVEELVIILNRKLWGLSVTLQTVKRNALPE